eukprot:2775893-Rhodomonas_salina.1
MSGTDSKSPGSSIAHVSNPPYTANVQYRERSSAQYTTQSGTTRPSTLPRRIVNSVRSTTRTLAPQCAVQRHRGQYRETQYHNTEKSTTVPLRGVAVMRRGKIQVSLVTLVLQHAECSVELVGPYALSVPRDACRALRSIRSLSTTLSQNRTYTISQYRALHSTCYVSTSPYASSVLISCYRSTEHVILLAFAVPDTAPLASDIVVAAYAMSIPGVEASATTVPDTAQQRWHTLCQYGTLRRGCVGSYRWTYSHTSAEQRSGSPGRSISTGHRAAQ